jgi:GT2 family glycosyltransferase
MSEFLGYFEGVRSDGWATGWLHWTDPARGKASADVLVDGVHAATVTADEFREDLFQAQFADPACAFMFRVPEEYLDGAEHVIDIRMGGESIPNAPNSFALAISYSVESGWTGAATANLVPNAAFDQWPRGLVVRPEERHEEILSGWFFDLPRGTAPAVEFSADRSGDLGVPPGHFLLRAACGDKSGEAVFRVLVPLEIDPAERTSYSFSMGLRRPAQIDGNNLHIAEISICGFDGRSAFRVASLRRNLHPKGTMRLRGLPVTIDDAFAAKLGDAQPTLVIEFRGKGMLELFTPEISHAPSLQLKSETVAGTFECENVQGQIPDLTLSPLWQPLGTAAPVEQPVAKGQARAVSQAMPFTQIVVPVFNAGPDVDEMVRSLIAHTPAPFEILLADDGSEGFTRQRLDDWAIRDPRIRVLRSPTNLGYTRNINQALQTAVASHVVLLNSDTIVTADWLVRLYEALSAAPDVVGAGPLSNAASWQSVPLTRAHGQWATNPLPAGISVDAMGELVFEASERALPEFPLLNGFCTLFRRDVLEQIGWFDDGTFPSGYGEENDLCLRLGRMGHKLRVADHAYVYHKKSRSFGADRRKALSRASGELLRAKHPEVSIERIEEVMRACAPLNRLRERLAARMGTENAT